MREFIRKIIQHVINFKIKPKTFTSLTNDSGFGKDGFRNLLGKWESIPDLEKEINGVVSVESG